MDTLYPANPSSVPPDLTKPGSIYKKRAWVAMGGLFLFLLIYAGFTYWFGHTAYKIFSGLSSGADIGFSGILSGIIASVLFIFMVKALFAVKHNGQVQDMEVTADQQPELFQFLNKLADDAGAPRPHKVYLSAQVNAAVFYDLSLLNLFFPSKKNLLIGLGLVNILNLGELKAVLAHEFGHFAQRSMAVGRWVYIAQQIASHIVAKRDWLDSFLQGLSRIDLRIAWIGWILRLIVWSVRSLLDTLFGLVVLSERALSRQMEFQADLVAVSLTGSDALVHALSKLSAGDDAWNKTLNFVNKELGEGRKVKDVFAIQIKMLEKLRSIYQNENYGKVDEVPADNPQSHRVFKSKIALPPQMWSTHPENTAREENAKRVYIACTIDNRSAWEIFRQADQIKIDMSQHLLRGVTKEVQEVELHESLNHLDMFYQKVWLSSEYRGSYLGRSVVRHAASVQELYDELPSIKPDDFEELYPESLTHQLEDLRDLQEEKAMLEALRDKMLKASGGIQFRGKLITKKELPGCIKQVIDEINSIETVVIAHHKKIRSIHLAAASTLGSGWKDYSLGLLSVLHYVDHAEADFNDATALVANVWSIITADGKVSNNERQRLVAAVSSVHQIMETLYQQSNLLQLDSALVEKWGYKTIAEVVGTYEVSPPTTQNIGDWMNIFDGWTGVFRFALSELKFAALELLLLTEKQMAQAYQSNQALAAAPEASRVPESYNLLLPGKERKKQKKLDLWDSFITASGLVPAIARFAVAGTIIGAVFWLG